jgi:DNA-binding CsgD family transcriptional regulator
LFYIIGVVAQAAHTEVPVWFRRRALPSRPALQGSLLAPREPAGLPAEWREGAGNGGRLVFETDEELADELRLAARARGQAPETLAADLITRGLSQEARRAEAEAILNTLTHRERQVAWLAASGKTNRQIAEALVVSPETVKTHVTHVLHKLGVRSKVDLRVFALDLELREPEALAGSRAETGPGGNGRR